MHEIPLHASQKTLRGLIPRSKENEGNDKQLGIHETKKIYAAKETVTKMNSQPTDWEEIFALHTTDRGLIVKIYTIHQKQTSQ